MILLAIETSCDETSAAVLDGKKILSNVIFSQIDLHRIYGGVVPEIAAREHLNRLPLVVDEALKKSGVALKDIEGMAVTYGPGLAGSLIVGLSYAKGIAYSLEKKFIGINHLEAHMLSPFLEHADFDYPFIGLVVSGGHTNIYLAKEFGIYELIGSTRDDAAGGVEGIGQGLFGKDGQPGAQGGARDGLVILRRGDVDEAVGLLVS